MLSEDTNKYFKKMIYDARSKFKYADYNSVSPETKFLPIDLSLMLSYMYQ
jgi:hypothetical protein